MIRFNRFTLCALLLCFSLSAAADDIQEANKFFKQGQYVQALVKVDVILSNKPKDAQARFLKGVIMTEQGQTEEAARLFTALTEDYPELPEPYNNLAVLYAGQGQFDKAKLALEKALRTHPSYAAAHENLGDIYAKMASQAYDRALQLDRSNDNLKPKLALLKDIYTPASKTSATKTHIASLSTPAVAASMAVVAVSPAPSVASAPVESSNSSTTAQAVVASTGGSNNVEVLKALHDWAHAWSSKNVNQYLAMYAQSFIPPGNETRRSWEQQRRERIAKPQPIVVAISDARVKLQDDTHATVSFVQSYRSGTLKSITHKTLEMVRSNGAWQIQSERAGTKR